MTLLIPAVLSFIATFVLVLFVKEYMFESGVVAMDHNKKDKPTLPSGCGIAAAMGFTIGILAYAFGGSFNLYLPVASLVTLFALSLSVVLVSLVGLLDDMNVKSAPVRTTDMSDTRKGLKQWQKPVITLLGAIPLIAINAGNSIVTLPFIGALNFGIFYPLIIIPLAVIFASNAFNLLGGFDGIATGTGLIAAIALLIYSIFFGTYTGALISGVIVATLVVFFAFNIYPSRLIPGDSFTYFVGTALVADMIIGNMEAFGLIVFAPWIIEFVLHAIRKFKVTDLGKPRKDGTMEPPYGKRVYSWTHLLMNLKPSKEWEISAYMWLVEIAFVLIAFAAVAMH
jgi:UDP-N-acetylglucosamine--dolichyl-phosphate N-acetylglucosaminephosphotransferase